MTYAPKEHHRRSIRLPGYDYSQVGVYYITICVNNQASLFGYVADYEMMLNEVGTMIASTWMNLPVRFSDITIDEFVVMPNHFHGIIHIVGAPLVGAQIACNEDMINGAGTRPAPTLGDIVGAYKSITTNEYIKNVSENNWCPFSERLWQRNYYERVIRNYDELHKTQNYIINNPARWHCDRENPDFVDI